jgi:hypothetical protein
MVLVSGTSGATRASSNLAVINIIFWVFFGLNIIWISISDGSSS